MRILHGPDACFLVELRGKSDHLPAVLLPEKGYCEVFVRAVWRQKRLVDIKQTLRELDVPTTRNGGIIGLSGPDFSKMTRGLFDRQA